MDVWMENTRDDLYLFLQTATDECGMHCGTSVNTICGYFLYAIYGRFIYLYRKSVFCFSLLFQIRVELQSGSESAFLIRTCACTAERIVLGFFFFFRCCSQNRGGFAIS